MYELNPTPDIMMAPPELDRRYEDVPDDEAVDSEPPAPSAEASAEAAEPAGQEERSEWETMIAQAQQEAAAKCGGNPEDYTVGQQFTIPEYARISDGKLVAIGKEADFLLKEAEKHDNLEDHHLQENHFKEHPERPFVFRTSDESQGYDENGNPTNEIYHNYSVAAANAEGTIALIHLIRKEPESEPMNSHDEPQADVVLRTEEEAVQHVREAPVEETADVEEQAESIAEERAAEASIDIATSYETIHDAVASARNEAPAETVPVFVFGEEPKVQDADILLIPVLETAASQVSHEVTGSLSGEALVGESVDAREDITDSAYDTAFSSGRVIPESSVSGAESQPPAEAVTEREEQVRSDVREEQEDRAVITLVRETGSTRIVKDTDRETVEVVPEPLAVEQAPKVEAGVEEFVETAALAPEPVREKERPSEEGETQIAHEPVPAETTADARPASEKKDQESEVEDMRGREEAVLGETRVRVSEDASEQTLITDALTELFAETPAALDREAAMNRESGTNDVETGHHGTPSEHIAGREVLRMPGQARSQVVASIAQNDNDPAEPSLERVLRRDGISMQIAA